MTSWLEHPGAADLPDLGSALVDLADTARALNAPLIPRDEMRSARALILFHKPEYRIVTALCDLCVRGAPETRGGRGARHWNEKAKVMAAIIDAPRPRCWDNEPMPCFMAWQPSEDRTTLQVRYGPIPEPTEILTLWCTDHGAAELHAVALYRKLEAHRQTNRRQRIAIRRASVQRW